MDTWGAYHTDAAADERSPPAGLPAACSWRVAVACECVLLGGVEREGVAFPLLLRFMRRKQLHNTAAAALDDAASSCSCYLHEGHEGGGGGGDSLMAGGKRGPGACTMRQGQWLRYCCR